MLTLDLMQPEYECPEKLSERLAKRTQEEDDVVSRSAAWVHCDMERLFIDRPKSLPQIPYILMPRPLQVERSMEYQAVDGPCEDDPPLTDFNY